MADHLTSYRLAWTKGARIAALILLALGAVRAKALKFKRLTASRLWFIGLFLNRRRAIWIKCRRSRVKT